MLQEPRKRRRVAPYQFDNVPWQLGRGRSSSTRAVDPGLMPSSAPGLVPRNHREEGQMLRRALRESAIVARHSIEASEALAAAAPAGPVAASEVPHHLLGDIDGDALSDGSDDGDGELQTGRCLIYGCKRQLLYCYGHKDVGSSTGCAEEGHIVCADCLERWYLSQNELREERGLRPACRPQCPVCRCELRATSMAVRNDDEYFMGLQKVEGTW